MKRKILSYLFVLIFTFTSIPFGVSSVMAETEKPIISLDSVSALPGSTVDVNISVKNNPGILGAKLKLNYDEGLELKSLNEGEAFSPLTFTKPGKLTSSCNLVWDGQEISDSEAKDGIIMTLTFTIPDNATAGTIYNISLSYESGDIVDGYLNTVNASVINGKISTIEYLIGDLNSDKIVNATDVILLRRNIAGGYELDINEKAGDVNKDNKCNSADVIHTRRYIAGGYPDSDIFFTDPVSVCEHQLLKTIAKEPTCTEDGNNEYYYCAKCDKYYSDAAGTKETTVAANVIEATGHTPSEDGKTCTKCGQTIEQNEYDYTITYDIANGDSYLEKQTVKNNNPEGFNEDSSFSLKNISVPGYVFKGWYDENDNKVTTIAKGTQKDINLYAKWEKIEYTVQFTASMINDNPGSSEPDKIKSFTYTVDKGATLQPLKMDTYNFIGWSDTNGHFYKNNIIPVGTIGDIMLKDNWVSQRNIAKAKTKLDDPLVVEDSENQQIFLCYEIGTIENVPLYTTQTLQCVNGIVTIQSQTVEHSITKEEMQSWGSSIYKETTDSTQFTLSKELTDITEVSEKYIKENGYDKVTTEEEARSQTNTTSFSTESGGSSQNYSYNDTTTKNSSNQNLVVNKNLDTGVSHDLTTSFNNTTEVSAGVSFPIDIVSINAGVKNTTEIGATSNTKDYINSSVGSTSGWASSTYSENNQKNSTTNTKNWNTTSSQSAAQTASQSNSVSEAIHEMISSEYGYGKTYSETNGSSESRGLASTTGDTEESSTTIVYTEQTIESKTTGYQTTGNTFGNYRLVMAGTMHVFAVVGYDVATQDYFVYTYNVLGDGSNNDGWHEIIDYSYTRSFDDYENSVIPFEIPVYVNQFVDSRITKTEGLEYDFDNKNHTATVEEYNGSDKIVYVPSYMVDENGTAYKVTGITDSAFKGKDIKGISLGRCINEIPDYAFKGCNSLEYVISPAVTKIGKEAFSGCISMKEYKVSKQVTYVGENAFYDVPEIVAEIGYNKDKSDEAKIVAENLADSGAKSITVDISDLPKDYELSINVDNNTDSFVLDGKEKEFSNISVESHASETSIQNIYFVECNKIPLKLYSDKVNLYKLEIEDCSTYAVLLGDDNTNLELSGTNIIKSLRDNAVICKNMKVSSVNSGKLKVNGNVLVCGEITGNKDRISFIDGSGEIKSITEKEFDMYEKGFLNVYLDSNGGTVSKSKIEAYCGAKIGTLPTPTRDYYTFEGWYTEPENDKGVKITSDSIMTSLSDITLYAHWSENDLSAWTLISDIPEDAEIVDRMFKYELTTYTTSSLSSLSGWNQYDSSWEWSGYGNWSAWQDNSVSSNDSRQVETRSIVASYNMSSYYWKRNWYSYYPGGGGNHSKTIDASVVDNATTLAAGSWLSAGGEGNADGYINGGTAYIIDGYGEGWTQAYFKQSSNYKEQWRYRDRTKIYTYYYKKIENLESTERPEGNNISNVQEYVQYRLK